MMRNGYTLLEVLLVLSLIALLAVLALPQYHASLARHQQQTDVTQWLAMLDLARQHALLQNTVVSVCPYQADGHCGRDWSQGLFVFKGDVLVADLQLMHGADIFLKTFPAGSEYLLQFSGNGYTHTQNGSFYYCPKDANAAQRIVFNQAGRAYVTIAGAVEGCL